MTTRIEKERTKQIQDKCQNLLNQMLRDEDNKYCVDCDAKGPRWASWNLGIFLCIRCAGIHRNLGVHISKVKSVNLDTWTPEQVVSLQQMGNSRARAVYEANLPDSFRRPQTDGSLESFIRAKYEHKKYIAREWVPPSLPKINWDKELDDEAEKQRRRKKEGIKSNAVQNPLPPVKKPEVVPQLPKPRSSISPKPNRISNSGGGTLDLLGLGAPGNENIANGSSSGDDIFTSFLSATPSSTSTSNGAASTTTAAESSVGKSEEEIFFNQTAPSAQEKSKMTKDSILALYGTPSHQQQSLFGVTGGMFAQQIPVQQFTQQNVGAFHQNSFPSQQVNQPFQMGMQATNQMTQLCMNPQMGSMGASSIAIGQMNSSVNMQAQIMNPLGQSNVTGNNSWNGMMATPNILPAPGSNPFFNLPTQQLQNSGVAPQLQQQMSGLSLNGVGFPAPGKPAPPALPGQTLSTNLWQ
ncbi:stromal membrane-associated protein 1-like [Belonocnema kinseyi]|uniref:stromal membrane-associated protein 1-like n=1 Tax=Belonocnema kinseyi TaxID=2817044 RepID=UPI00143CCAFA|nr:stromal membrane-associated protein 1-like [Belonocnema kinseyi]